jgi:hypothetical protein
MAESYDDVRAAILAVYRQLCADHEMARQNVEVVQAHQRTLKAKINDCFAAARLFEFDLVAEFQGAANGDPRQSTLRASAPIAPTLFPVPPAPATKPLASIKTLVLEFTERAYPHPTRAADIRHNLELMGYPVHEKTVGMTLYRWSLDGCVRRNGWDWFFIPFEQRRPADAKGHRFPRDARSESVVRLVS